MTARRVALSLLVAFGSLAAGCGAARPPARPAAPSPPPAATSPPPRPSVVSGTWTELGAVHPLWIARNRPGVVADAAHPLDAAYCASGSVRLSHDGGRRWSALSTAGAVAATAGTPFPVKVLRGESAPSCSEALGDPAHGRSAYAVFVAGPAKYGMPPVYSIPLATTDGGRRWRVVAPPPGFGPGGFGGFRAAGGRVLAIFGRPGGGTGFGPGGGPGAGSGDGGGSPFGVVATADGGTAWRPAGLSCPAAGPCVAWGPAASGIGSCAMHAYPQAIEASADGGRSWRPLKPPAGAPLPLLANGCALNQLVGLSATRVALVSDGLPEPGETLRISDDGGASWHTVRLPALPGGGTPGRGLQMLPSGALLAPVFVKLAGGSFGFRLELLRPGSPAWCQVPGVTPSGTGTDPATLQAAGRRLWWIAARRQAPPVARSVALSALHC